MLTRFYYRGAQSSTNLHLSPFSGHTSQKPDVLINACARSQTLTLDVDSIVVTLVLRHKCQVVVTNDAIVASWGPHLT